MLALLILLSQPMPIEPHRCARDAVVQVSGQVSDRVSGRSAAPLKTLLERAFEAANARAQGLFHEDVTSIVAPFFPLGQPIDELRRTAREQGLGALEPFKGVAHERTAMYVARVRLTSGSYDNVHVVVDFDFDDDMRLTRLKAFMRASNM